MHYSENEISTVYLDDPCLGSIEKEYLMRCIDTNYVSISGPFVQEFETAFAKLLGISSAVSVQSGTSALHMSLHQLGIGPGDEVIVPALTFIASVNPILYVGAKPVIVDVNQNTWNIDSIEIEKAITPHTKSIIPVHLYGNPCDMDAILNISRKHNISIIEDATESLGAKYKKRYTGTLGTFGCFSFNGNKIITTGGGGMVVSDDVENAGHLKFLVNQARDKTKGYFHPEMGFNYRMTNIEAALGLAQLTKLEKLLAKKKNISTKYYELLGDLKAVKFQRQYDGTEPSYWFTCISLANDIDINEVAVKLEKAKIPIRRLFMPITEMPYLEQYANDCPHACELYKTGICLPSSPLNKIETIERVALTLRGILSA